MNVNKIMIIASKHRNTPMVPVADVLPVPAVEIISAKENLNLLSAVTHIS
jgi:hypothetical protein